MCGGRSSLYLTSLALGPLRSPLLPLLSLAQLLFDAYMRPTHAYAATLVNGSSVNVAVPLVGDWMPKPMRAAMFGEPYSASAARAHAIGLQARRNLSALPRYGTTTPWLHSRLPWDDGSERVAGVSVTSSSS